MHLNAQQNHIASLFIVGCCALLMAIWALPETIALRHILLTAGFFVSLFYLRGNADLFYAKAAWPFWVLLGFYVWIGIHLQFFSSEQELQLQELHGLWIRTALATFLGVALGLCMTDKNAQKPSDNINLKLGIFFAGLCGTGVISLTQYSHICYLRDQWVNFDILLALYKAKTPFVIATALLSPMSFILIIRSLNRQMSRWWIVAALIGTGLSLFGVYFSNTKNGIAIFVIALTIFLTQIVFSILRWNKTSIGLAGLAITVILSISLPGIEKHIERNSAWQNLVADAKIGLDIDHQNYWKNRNTYPQPSNELGRAVDISTYERVAWFKAGARLLAENPLGFGLAHHSFGWLAKKKWSDFYKPNGNLRGATHSGWMDMALAFGIPGILLIWLPLFCAWYRSLYQEGIWFSYASWAIPIMIFAYLTAEVNGAHFTELLFFMTAFFLGLTLQYPKNHN